MTTPTGWRGNKNPPAVVPVFPVGDGTFAPADDSTFATAAWTQPAWVTTTAASATPVLTAGLATKALIIQNNHASETANITWNGVAASSTTGYALAAGKTITFDAPTVPENDISAYTEGAGSLSVAYA